MKLCCAVSVYVCVRVCGYRADVAVAAQPVPAVRAAGAGAAGGAGEARGRAAGCRRHRSVQHYTTYIQLDLNE